ncbi:MAG: hypothetical protein IIB19_06605 [Chloroflexi bacterium]|nr:hypothetical protein [Chloroflexota bacterium]
MDSPPARREIDLHRRVCVIKPDTIEIKPARSAAIAPLIGLFLAISAFVAVVLWLEQLPFVLALLLMGAAIVLVPFSGMGFVYSVYGANVVIDRKKQTAIWQQGLLGMGVGTEELVPFAKIERLELEETSREPQEGEAQDFAQYEILLLKTSGRRLPLGQVTVPRYMADDGLARAREVAQAIADLVEKPLHEDERPRRYRRQTTATGV